MPKNYDVRPTADRVKESLFNIIGSKIVDAAVLDLFAGSGNLGLESWSRGARLVQFVDNSRVSLRLTESNIQKCRQRSICCINRGNGLIWFLWIRLITKAGCRKSW